LPWEKQLRHSSCAD